MRNVQTKRMLLYQVHFICHAKYYEILIYQADNRCLLNHTIIFIQLFAFERKLMETKLQINFANIFFYFIFFL